MEARRTRISVDTVRNAGHWRKSDGVSNTIARSSVNIAVKGSPEQRALSGVSSREGSKSGGAANSVRVIGWHPDSAIIENQTDEILSDYKAAGVPGDKGPMSGVHEACAPGRHQTSRQIPA